MKSSRELRQLVSESMGRLSDLKASNLIFANKQTASTLTHRGWALNFLGNVNTGKERDKNHWRPAHTIQIQLGHQLALAGASTQSDTLDLALDDSDLIVTSLLADPTLASCMRLEYKSTSHSLTASGDYIYTQIQFEVESFFDIY